ncbi:thiamine phosphate synthase [Methylocapsa acidiphila]|uniref:thiamine phosphate synthase n=1 Tax=Methylocapsa acidiphila TaxID=133552 RepID=UPI0003F7C865
MELPRLYLITPPIADGADFAPALAATLAAGDAACLLLRTAARDEIDRKKIIRALAPLTQKHGVACLIADDPQLALKTDADGVHIESDGEPLKAALKSLKPNRIVGAGGLMTRDSAMTAGEAGVDYLMFGGPDGPDGSLSHANIVERVAWWAEIFNVPCIGYAHGLDCVGDLVRAGADFIALGDAVFADPRGAPAAMREFGEILARVSEPAQ